MMQLLVWLITDIGIVSGGFANVHPNNTLTINAVEAAPLEDFSPEVKTKTLLHRPYPELNLCISQAVRTNLQDAQRVLAGNGSEEEKAEARIEADVYEALQHALSTK
jgi:F-type H+-transporting ATPase subunit delta